MAKKKKSSDVLGKLLVEGNQSSTNIELVVLSVIVIVIGLVVAIVGMFQGPMWVVVGIGAVLSMVGIAMFIKGISRMPIHVEIRKLGVRFESGRREFEETWDELDSVFIQMLTTNSLITLTGVNDAGEYIHKRANSMPYQVRFKTKQGRFFTFHSGIMPFGTGRLVLGTICDHLPDNAIAYELFATFPVFRDDDD